MPTIHDPRSRSSSHGYRTEPRAPRTRCMRRSRTIFGTIIAIIILYIWHPWHPRPLIHAPTLRYRSVNWSRYAYVQYATNSAYLCNSVMVFEALDRLGSKADRLLIYPQGWDTEIENMSDRDSQLLVKARDWYNVKLVPVETEEVGGAGEEGEDDTWRDSFTKFLAFSQTQYERIIFFDSDVTVLRHMDDLFLLPKTPIAMLRAYWMIPTRRMLTSLFMLLEPSEIEYQRLMNATRTEHRNPNDWDMEILNALYADSAMVLPHRMYGLITGELRSKDHTNYFGNDYEEWNVQDVLNQAALVHFSDWPLPKPWVMWPHNLLGDITPKCVDGDCGDKKAWLGLYDDFRRRRKDICALLSEPAPTWPPPPSKTSVADEG